MAETPTTVTVKALELHTYHGKSYKVGATYDCDEGDVETLEVQGKATRVENEKGAYKTTAGAATRTTALKPGTKARPTAATPAKKTTKAKAKK